MKQNEFHQYIQKYIPQITFLETDSTELAEAECRVWGRDDCTLLIELANPKINHEDLQSALQQIATKIQWIDEKQHDILQNCATETQFNTENASIDYVAFWVENADDVFCDFVIGAPNWQNRVAAYALEEDNELIFNGLETDN